MSGDVGTVAYYHERALAARVEAGKTTNRELADELLRLAAAFDALAERKKRQARDSA